MKKTAFIFCCFLLIAFGGAAQKRFNVGVKAGICATQVEGDTYSGFNKVGFAGGAFVTAKFTPKWTAQMEMIFIQKGSKHNPSADPDYPDPTLYYMGLNYIEVPVLLQYHLQKFTFEAGPTFGYLISSKEYDQNGDIYMALPFRKSEIGVAAGVSFLIIKNLAINWRYENSVFAIRKYKSGESRWYNPGQQNNVLALTLSYQFGGTDAKSK